MGDNQADYSELKLCGSIFGDKGLLFPRVVIKAVVSSLSSIQSCSPTFLLMPRC